MLNKKTIVIALGCALALGASGAAFAVPVNVDGVTWNTNNPFNLTIQSLNLRETQVSQVGDVLNGYGQIGSINAVNDFCVGTGSGCDLTFTFSYTVQSIKGNQVVFNNGSFQFYVDDTKSYNAADPTSASIGTPWVTLSGHTSKNTTFTDDTGQLFSIVTGPVNHPKLGSAGFGLVDATSGDAMPYLTPYFISDGMGGYADLSLSSSFQFFPANGCSGISPDATSVCHFPIEGNGSLVGTVPEPGALGLMGLGLGLLGFLVWRRRKESEEGKQQA